MLKRLFIAVRLAGSLLNAPTPAAAGPRYGLIGRIIAKPGQRDALIDVLLEGCGSMPGCLSYIVARDARDCDAVWVNEVWDSKASHAASLNLPSVQAAIGRGRSLIAAFDSYTETMPAGGAGLIDLNWSPTCR